MVALSVKHAFTSAKGDGPDTTRVKPTNWNAEHTLVLDGDGVVLGRPAGAGPGPVVPVDVSALMPAGVIVDFAGSVAPPGWLLCFGQLLSRTTEAALFAAIGTQYGAGDGSTTFRLPDPRGLVAAGKSDMGGADRGNLAGGTVLGAALGAQTNFANVSGAAPGNIVNDGANRTAGSLDLAITGVGGPTEVYSRGDQGGGMNVAGQSHGHVITGITTGQLAIFANIIASININSSAFSIVQGTIVFNKIIKR